MDRMDTGVEEIALFVVETVGGGEFGLLCLVLSVVPVDVLDINRSEHIGELRTGRERVDVFVDAPVWILGVADVDHGSVVHRVGSLELGGELGVVVTVVETTLEFDVLNMFTPDDVDGVGLRELVNGRHIFVGHPKYPEILVGGGAFGVGTLHVVVEFDVSTDDAECGRRDGGGASIVRVWWFDGHLMRLRVSCESGVETVSPSLKLVTGREVSDFEDPQ